MKIALALTKRLFAFSAGDVIVFGSVVAILMIAFAQFALPLAAVGAIGLSWWLGWALQGVLDSSRAVHREHRSQEEWLQRAAVLEVAPNDLDGLGS